VLAEPFAYRASRLSIGASIGFAVFPAHDTSSVELFKSADLALYAAKNEGRQQVKEYGIEMRLALERRVALVADLKQAIGRGLLVPFYQPKVDLRTGAIVGFEALARWTHPTRGVLTPQEFGSAFDDPELAVAIGETMVAQVLRDLAGWLGDGIECGRIAVNFSAYAITIPDLADRLAGQLESAGIPPARFEIEVTETVFLDGDAANVAAILRRFHDLGIRISLDDFGTGYASLTHLKRFPVDEIKIDRSFIRDLEEDPDDAAIVSAVIELGRSLGLKVVAEGIETEGQESRLRSWGCDFGQGYLFAKPMAASRVPWLIRNLPKRTPRPFSSAGKALAHP
jgi:predicted signal transduction protein with EAL and GGDEF domain